jgi:DNA-binding GntR family transcriptional regulator
MLKLDFLSNDYKEKKTAAQIAQENIEIDIITGKLPNGKRIDEQALCKKYNMSRTPIREILRKIEGNGLARSIHNRGVFAVGLSHSNIDDLQQMKSILEVQCVKWAIERITEPQLELLQETFDFMQFYTMSNDLDKILKINEGFDTIIYNAAHSPELEARLNRYNFIIKHAFSDIKYPQNYLETILEEHRAIFDAFIARDSEAGAEATEIHMYRAMFLNK